jgi:hypothetical protein
VTITSALVFGAGDFAIGDLRGQVVYRQFYDHGFNPDWLAKTKPSAAICRNVARAISGGEIDIWGNESQNKSLLDVNGHFEGTPGLRLLLFGESLQRA